LVIPHQQLVTFQKLHRLIVSVRAGELNFDAVLYTSAPHSIIKNFVFCYAHYAASFLK